MKLKKALAIILSTTLIFSITGCGGQSGNTTTDETASNDGTVTAEADTDKSETNEGTEDASEGLSTDGTTITFLNSGSGIEKFFEPAMKEYFEQTGVTVEWMNVNAGESPYEAIQKLYAAGNAPTLALLDCNDIVELGPEKGVPLDGEDWVAIGGDTYGIKVDGVLYSAPLSLQGRGILFNRTAIENALGKDFDEYSIKTLDDFVAICDELQAAGMEYPTCISKEDWSLGAHYMGLVFEQQGSKDAVGESGDAFRDSLIDGTANMIDNARFTSLMDTFDVLMKYNINGADPLGADYEMDNCYYAEGDVAFWFNGNWVWEVVEGYTEEDMEYGMLPVVQNQGTDDIYNTLCNAVGSKQIMIDKTASDVEIQAAKDFLNWLVYDEAAHVTIADELQLVPCFSTFDASPKNKLGVSLKEYVDAGNTYDQYNGLPGDHWSSVGAYMQKYLGGESSREELASSIDSYWQSQK